MATRTEKSHNLLLEVQLLSADRCFHYNSLLIRTFLFARVACCWALIRYHQGGLIVVEM